jgi:hypothetical protein
MGTVGHDCRRLTTIDHTVVITVIDQRETRTQRPSTINQHNQQHVPALTRASGTYVHDSRVQEVQ